MAEDVRLWRVAPDDQLSEVLASKLDLEKRLENWIARDISILSHDLLVIGRQLATTFGGFIDLLCIDEAGDLTVVELKRDKTPREVVAQTIDYASWVQDLSRERVVEIGDTYLATTGGLEEVFSRKFGTELPDALNESHRMLIVGSAIDDSSERIVRYLSDKHGVGINVATFTYFREDDREYLARIFLIEPDEVEQRQESKGTSKRKTRPSYEDFEALAREHGVGDLYEAAVVPLRGLMKIKRVLGHVGFYDHLDRGKRSMLNLIPVGSDSASGLRYEVYEMPTRDRFGLDEATFRTILPADHANWVYSQGDDYHGFTGHFKTIEEVRRFTGALEAANSALSST